MAAREFEGDVIDVPSRVILSERVAESPAVAAAPAPTQAPVEQLNLVPSVVAKTEIAKANPALLAMKALIAKIEGELPKLNLATKEGEKRYRELRAECVTLRTSTETAYETWNKPVLEAQRGIREVVKQVAAGISPTELALDKAIKDIDAAREAEKQRKLQIEQARIAALRAKITDIAAMPAAAVKMTTATLDAAIKHLRALEIDDGDDSFAEFHEEAAALRENIAAELQLMLNGKLEAEAEAARLEQQRQAQAEERRKLDAERAEQDRQAAEQRAELLRQAAELQRQRDELAAAEAKRKADEEARIAAAAAEEQRKKDAEAAAQRAKVERDARIEERIKNLRNVAMIATGCSSANIAKTIESVSALVVDVDNFGDRYNEAVEAKRTTLVTLADAASAAAVHERTEAEARAKIEAEAAERAERAAEEQARLAAEAEATEARALDSEAVTFDDIVGNVIDALADCDYPSGIGGSREILTLLTHPKVQAAMAARLKALA